jgi:hypothetical protein
MLKFLKGKTMSKAHRGQRRLADNLQTILTTEKKWRHSDNTESNGEEVFKDNFVKMTF